MNTRIVSIAIIILVWVSVSWADTQQELALIRDTFLKNDTRLTSYVIDELIQFINVHSGEPIGAEASTLLGTVYRNKGDEHNALVTYYKTLFHYGNFAHRDSCIEHARYLALTVRAFRDNQKQLLTILDHPINTAAANDRAFQFVAFLKKLDQKGLQKRAIKEARLFLQNFSDDVRTDSVQLWLGAFYESDGENLEAIQSYEKLIGLYPNSSLVPAAYFACAPLYRKSREYGKAVEMLEKLTAHYPDDEHAGSALYMIGEIYEKSQKEYIKAVENFRRLANNYPDDENAPEALLSIANIQEKKFGQYSEAIKTYNEFFEKYAGHPQGVEMLEKVAKMYEKEINDYEQAAQYYAKVAVLYPEHTSAPWDLFKAGRICEDRLNNYAQAIVYYQQMLDRYPHHKKAGDAEKNLIKASENKEQGYIFDPLSSMKEKMLAAQESVVDEEGWDRRLLDTARYVDYLSAAEKDLIYELNKVRTNPKLYAEQYLKPMSPSYNGRALQKSYKDAGQKKKNMSDLDECMQALEKSMKRAVLKPSKGLCRAAADHVKSQGPIGAVGHEGPDGSTMTQRILRYGERGDLGSFGENISYGRGNPRSIVIQLLIDEGVPSRGHRKNIMSSSFSNVGVSIGTHKAYQHMCVMDFARSYTDGGAVPEDVFDRVEKSGNFGF